MKEEKALPGLGTPYIIYHNGESIVRRTRGRFQQRKWSPYEMSTVKRIAKDPRFNFSDAHYLALGQKHHHGFF